MEHNETCRQHPLVHSNPTGSPWCEAATWHRCRTHIRRSAAAGGGPWAGSPCLHLARSTQMQQVTVPSPS